MDSNQRLPPCQGDTLPTELRGQKRNGSISKKSLNSKQILIFRKIPPKFYTKISPRRKIPSNSTRNFTILPKPRAKSIPQLKFAIPRGILLRLRGARVFCLSSLFCSALFYLIALLHPASFHLLALLRPVLFRPLASLRLEPVKTSKFSHSALEFLRFVASRLDPP